MRGLRLALPLPTLPLAALTAACASATATPTAQLRELMDRQEITALVDRLGRALDEGRFDDLRAIYTPGATAKTPGGTAEGRDALIAQASRNHGEHLRIQHVVGNVLIDLHGDTAEVRANLIATFALATSDGTPPPPVYTLGEVYRFDAVRTGEGWRLSRVQTTPVWSTGKRP
ncbi:nuclear transport factor 2 family protein [Nocardia sp. NPDC004085]|uniref:nuclear transport factor 2 family protein n=1 Tax=Nocardia sp. NPDC019255 TaxID=3154591 RepID=UPI0033E4D833